MFGNKPNPKPPVLKPRPVPKICDVVGDQCNFGHIAREPNTSYKILLMQYHQAKNEEVKRTQEDLAKKVQEENISGKTIKHNEKMSYKRSLNTKVDKKMEEYDQTIEKRRNKLGDLIWREERELLRELVEEAQKAKQSKIQEQTAKLQEIKEKREAERQAIVQEKRILQYLDRSSETRPQIAKQRLIESKQIQLLQMKDNQAKRKSEEESEYFWHQMMLKYCESLKEREENDKLNKLKLANEFKFIANLQIKHKKAQEEKRRQEILKEGKQLDKLREELEKEEKAYLEKTHKTKKELLETFQAQVKEHRERLQRIADQEKKIQRAYDTLADIEIKKEQAKKLSVVSRADEVAKYQKYITELKQQKAEQEKLSDKEIEETMKAIQRVEDEKKCQVELAKQALKEAVLEGRQQQIKENKKKLEELKELQDLENEFTNALEEQNTKLRAEHERQLMLKEKKYREDLKQQIMYQKQLKAREEENNKKILEASKAEEAFYEKMVAEIISGNIKVAETHPFGQAINKQKCPCPKPIY